MKVRGVFSRSGEKARFCPVLAMVRNGLHIKKFVVLRDDQKRMNLLREGERDSFVLYYPKICIV
jgi:hypothetical protein